jgi:predicted nucleic acid-binding protein
MTAVCNTTPLIYLAKADLLSALQGLYGSVYIPEEVYQEAVVKGLARGYADAQSIEAACQDWLTRRSVGTNLLTALGSLKIPRKTRNDLKSWAGALHRVDAQTIALAIEIQADVLVMDDRAPLRFALKAVPYFRYEVFGSGDVIDAALAQKVITPDEHTRYMNLFSASAAWISRVS